MHGAPGPTTTALGLHKGGATEETMTRLITSGGLALTLLLGFQTAYADDDPPPSDPPATEPAPTNTTVVVQPPAPAPEPETEVVPVPVPVETGPNTASTTSYDTYDTYP